ncbi:MAG TPA: hypothetical protein DF613_04380, partial [Lachnospiraceae bacterium]|nr:hypothetical protein [Lachnospiraceae bacterium]
MEMTASCMACLLNKEEKRLREQTDEKKKAACFREIMGLLAAEGDVRTAPYLVSRIREIYAGYFTLAEDFVPIKRHYNRLMLDREADFRSRIGADPDPVRTALCFAQTANYIDFGANNQVTEEQLTELFDKADPLSVDGTEYGQFCEDLEHAGNFLLLADNCGEIVLDKLLIETLQKRWPRLSCAMMVRGGNVSNDVTLEDAAETGVDKVARVISNGTRIGGTDAAHVSAEARRALEEADVILAKGQGNFETAYGSGYNIY